MTDIFLGWKFFKMYEKEAISTTVAPIYLCVIMRHCVTGKGFRCDTTKTL